MGRNESYNSPASRTIRDPGRAAVRLGNCIHKGKSNLLLTAIAGGVTPDQNSTPQGRMQETPSQAERSSTWRCDISTAMIQERYGSTGWRLFWQDSWFAGGSV